MHLFQAATEDHIRSLLSEDSDQNVDESIVDQLLDDWKKKYVPKKMKGLKNRYALVDLGTILLAYLLLHIFEKMRVQIPLETTNFSLSFAVSD